MTMIELVFRVLPNGQASFLVPVTAPTISEGQRIIQNQYPGAIVTLQERKG